MDYCDLYVSIMWHQNKYDDPDPLRSNQPFSEETPFISTTAGTVVRDNFNRTNILEPAQLTALRFATNGWQGSGMVVYCYVFILGKKAVGHEQFSEELRELNIYTGYSPYQPEGEITAKIQIPTTQIERIEVWIADDYLRKISDGYLDLYAITREMKPLRALTQHIFRHQETEGDIGVYHWRGKEITLEANPKQDVWIDGELGGQTPFTVTAVPEALEIVVPS